MEKSSTGLDANVAGLLAYLLGPIGGLVFYLIEKQSVTVRFHALQSLLITGGAIALNVTVSILGAIFAKMHLGFLSSILHLLLLPLGLAVFALVIICAIKAFQNDKFKIPCIADIAEKHAPLPPAPPAA